MGYRPKQVYVVRGWCKDKRKSIFTPSRTVTMTKHLGFAVATNIPAEYSSPKSAARHLAMYSNRPDFPLCDSVLVTHLWIEGPRGGIYNYATGKLHR